MHTLDTLLDSIPSPMAPGVAEPALAQAQGTLAAGELAADRPVAWLQQVADALSQKAAQDEAWAQTLPPDLLPMAARIEAELQIWQEAVTQAMARHVSAYRDLIPLGSQPEHYPRQWLQAHQEALRARLLARFGEAAPTPGTLTAYQAALTARDQAARQAQVLLSQTLAADTLEQQLEPLQGWIQQAMRAEIQLQVAEGRMPDAVLDILDTPTRSPVYLGLSWNGWPLPGAWVLSPAQSWGLRTHGLPLLLWVHGEGGGLAYFEDLPTLQERLTADLGAPLPTALGAQAQAAPQAGNGIELAPVEGALPAVLERLLAPVKQRLQELDDGAESWPGLSPSQALERALDEARHALAIPFDSERRAALAQVERQWQADALLEYVPTALLTRSDEEREAFARELLAYHEAAGKLEMWLAEQVPDFPHYAGRLLARRIEGDLGLSLQPEAVVLERPTSMNYEWFGPGTVLEPPPEGATLPVPAAEQAATGLRWVPSHSWESMTLQQLAVENLDLEAPEEIERLKSARLRVEGLSVAYLQATLPALDPLRRYEEHLRQCLDPQRASDPRLLRQPFELELKLQARIAHWEHRLSEAGRAMVESAAGVHDVRELQAQGLKVHWLVFNTTEELGRNLKGCCALVGAEGRTVLYLPGAPARYAWVERDNLDDALDDLRRALCAEPAMVTYVAERLDGDARVHSAYLTQAAQRGYDGYLSAPASLDQTLVDLQLHDRRVWLQARANAQGRSQRALWVSRNLAAHERHLGYLRAALAVIPGVGTLIGIQTVYESALLVSQGWRHEDADAVGLGVLGVLGGVLDILLSALPVGASLSSLRLAVRGQVQARLGRQALAGYEARVRLPGAVAQQGRDQGTWRWKGGQYIWQDGRAYAVYRRANETTLRLRATATRRYEAPVRRDGERWVMHAETGLRGGAPLTPAERIFASWGPGSRHEPFANASRQQALRLGRQLLAQYRFPEPSQASEFAYAYLIDGAPPAWALQYRVGPGTSVVVPRVTHDWQQVRWTLAADDTVTQTSHGNVVQISPHGQGLARTALRWQGEYYPLLPNRSAGSEWFIVPAGPAPGSVRELDDLIRQGRGPVRVEVSYTPNQAPIIHGGFSQTFAERLAQRFPRLSATTRQAWAEAVYRAADPEIEGLTQARLWALERLLARPTDPLAHVSIRWLDDLQPRLVPETSPTAFDQVRWPLEVAEHHAVRQSLTHESVPAFRVAMRAIIRNRGYELLFEHALEGRYLGIFRWPGEPYINVLVQTDIIGVLALQGNNGVSLLSESWLDMMISRIADMNVASMLRLARYRGRLRPVLGGIAFMGPESTELVWARIAFNPQAQEQVALMRNWRSALRPLDASDVETLPGSGLYRVEGESLVSGVRVDGQWLGVFPAAEDSRLLLSRPASVPAPLTFEALERCVRERFAEQPWLVVRQGQAWTVRRHLFLAPFDRMLDRVRPGLTPQSALNLAEAVFTRTQGSDHARLLHLEYVLSTWAGNSRAAGQLADPLLLLAPQRPAMLEAGGWRLGLPADLPTPAPAVLYLRATEAYTQNLVAALRRPRMRHHAANAIDDLLARYGLQLEHRLAGFAQYYQPATGRVYLVAYQAVEGSIVEVPLEGTTQVLSQAWVGQWQQRLNPSHAQRLSEALAQGLVVRLLAALRLDDQAQGGVLAVLRLADF